MSGRNHHDLHRHAAAGHGLSFFDTPPLDQPPHLDHCHHPPYPIDPRPDPFSHRGPLPPPAPHPAIVEEHLAAQRHEIQTLLVDNQRLAATHVALKQELSAAQYELHRVSQAASAMSEDDDLRLREAYKKSMKLEMELQEGEAHRAELAQVHGDIQKLNAAGQELSDQVKVLNQDLDRATTDLQQVPAMKAEIDTMKQEVQRARSVIEHEKKAYAAYFEQGQAMEKNLISMAREMEKLLAEIANAEKRARATAAAGNPGTAYGGDYMNPGPGYGGNPYSAGFGLNPVQGVADGGGQYGSGYGSWGAYDVQRAQGRR